MALLHVSETGWHYQRIPADARMFTAFRGLIMFATWAADFPDIDPLVDEDIMGAVPVQP
jgi:hypothetical protein